jgi:hypothetical protein
LITALTTLIPTNPNKCTHHSNTRQGRLVLRIEDADSGRPYATAALPLAEQRGQQRAATRLQRLPLHYCLEGEEDLGLSGSGRQQRRRRRSAQAQGPVIGA